MSASRYPEVKRRPDGTRGCRGCGGPIPKGRRSWCSKGCYERHDPDHVFRRVFKRDGGCCQMCAGDIKAMHADFMQRQRTYYSEWRANAPLDHGGRKVYPPPFPEVEPKAEFDHIIPFSEGGATVDENIRLLCTACHRKRTAAWHAERARLRKGAGKQLFLTVETLED